MGGQTFTRGQKVNVEIDGRQIESVFVRVAAPQQGADDERATAPSGERGAGLAWVRRSDTGEVEPVEIRLISPADSRA